MKPNIIKPEEGNLRQQVTEARDNMLTNRDLIKRIDELLLSPSKDIVEFLDLLKDCKEALLRTKQTISVK